VQRPVRRYIRWSLLQFNAPGFDTCAAQLLHRLARGPLRIATWRLIVKDLTARSTNKILVGSLGANQPEGWSRG